MRCISETTRSGFLVKFTTILISVGKHDETDPKSGKKINWKRTNFYSLIYIIIIFFIYLVLILGEISVKRFKILAGNVSHNLSLESKEGMGGWAEDLGESHVFYREKGGEISRRQQSMQGGLYN